MHLVGFNIERKLRSLSGSKTFSRIFGKVVCRLSSLEWNGTPVRRYGWTVTQHSNSILKTPLFWDMTWRHWVIGYRSFEGI